jgi:hypothetical protein
MTQGTNTQTQARNLIRGDKEVEVINEHKGVSTYVHFTFDDGNHEAEYVTVDLSTLYYLEDTHIDYHVEGIVNALLSYYGLEAKDMIILNPALPCSEEFAVTCRGGNMVCHLLRALYPQVSGVEGVSICQGALAGRVPIGIVDWGVAISLARYAVERLHVEKPVVVVLTDGFFKVITVAQRMGELN